MTDQLDLSEDDLKKIDHKELEKIIQTIIKQKLKDLSEKTIETEKDLKDNKLDEKEKEKGKTSFHEFIKLVSKFSKFITEYFPYFKPINEIIQKACKYLTSPDGFFGSMKKDFIKMDGYIKSFLDNNFPTKHKNPLISKVNIVIHGIHDFLYGVCKIAFSIASKIEQSSKSLVKTIVKNMTISNMKEFVKGVKDCNKKLFLNVIGANKNVGHETGIELQNIKNSMSR